MEFIEVVRKRRMVRNFTDEPVALSIVEDMLDLARRAPSAGYTQGQSFILITDEETRRAAAHLCGEKSYDEMGFGRWISKAPVMVVPCTREEAYHERYRQPDKLNQEGEEIIWPVPYWFMDIGCSVMTLLLAVVNEGLAAGFAGCPRMDELRQLLDIPQDVTPVGVIPIGHPAPDKRSPSLKRGRKPKPEVIHYEKW